MAGACKTSEANYRAAYERAVAARGDSDVDSTIYGDFRRQMRSRVEKLPDGRSVEVNSQLVRATPDGGGIPENLRRYNVVVGRFKQIFNARNLQQRYADGPLPGTFIVQTGEPYYYIIGASCSTLPEAVAAMDSIKAKVDFKSPLPFILDASVRR